MKELNISFFVDNVKDGEGNLQMRVRWDGSKVGVNLGYKVEVAKWDAEKQRCVANTTHSRKKITASEINREIRRYEDVAMLVAEEFPRSELEPQAYRKRLRESLGKKAGMELSPLVRDVFTRKIYELRLQGELADSYIRGLDAVAGMFSTLFPDLQIGQVADDHLKSFVENQLAEGCINSAVMSYCTLLKSLLNKCGVKLSYTPRLKQVRRTVVWLSWDELMHLYNAPVPYKTGSPKQRTAEIVRDMFCLSCFTGLRFSDISGLKKSDDLGTSIRRTIIKTGEVVYIETNKYSRAILDKYKDGDSPRFFSESNNGHTNVRLKELCKALGINSPVCMVYYKKNKRIEEIVPKHKVLTFHCGRRTFIVNALSLGIPPSVVMKWTGHKSYEEMRPYIDITDTAKASAMELFNR